MKKLEKKDLKKIVNDFNSSLAEGKPLNQVKTEFTKEILNNFEEKSILGFDIYKYSKYPLLEQFLIPYLFKGLYEATISQCVKYEPFLFQNYKDESSFTDYFIDTGDGGFQIFESPLHSVIFAMFFQSNIRRYNSYEGMQNLREIIGEVTLRYALTLDNLFYFHNNYYGPAIINNARIMAKDRLNRFLIDEKSYKWFNKNLNGIENLQIITLEDFKKIDFFKNYNFNQFESYIIPLNDNDEKTRKIKTTDILRIGEIYSKETVLSIYSIHIQALVKSAQDVKYNKFIISLGNLNTTGISD